MQILKKRKKKAGGNALRKEQTSVGQHGRDHTGKFTQVQAAVRCKTLLLLWLIDGGKVVVERSTPAQQGCLEAAVATCVRGCELSNLLTLLMVAMGLLL